MLGADEQLTILDMLLVAYERKARSYSILARPTFSLQAMYDSRTRLGAAAHYI